MTDTISFIEANLDNPIHADAILSLLDAFIQDPTINGQPMKPEPRAQLITTLKDFPTTLAFLAFENGTPVGLALCFAGFSSFQAKPLLNIHDFVVHPEYQGKGIGKKLLQYVLDEAKSRGYCKVTLEVLHDNTRAKALYEKFGFGEEGKTYLFLSKDV